MYIGIFLKYFRKNVITKLEKYTFYIKTSHAQKIWSISCIAIDCINFITCFSVILKRHNMKSQL